MPFCPLCHEALKVRWDDITDTETQDRFRILVCPMCGLGVTDPVPEDMDRYYGASYHGGRHGRTVDLCDRRRLRVINAVETPGRRLLDVGCGDGTFLLLAQKNGWQVTGVEKYPVQANKTGLCIFESLNQAMSAGPFDCVTLWHVLEHLDAPEKMLQSIRNLLTPGGVVVFAVPDFDSWIARWFGSRWLHLDVPRHLFHYSESSLGKMLQQNQWDFRRLSQSEFEYDWLGLAQSSLNQCGDDRNILFRRLTGRPICGNRWLGWAYTGLGLAVGALGTIPISLSNAMGRGGTLVMVARC